MTFWYAPASSPALPQRCSSLLPLQPPNDRTTSPPAPRMVLMVVLVDAAGERPAAVPQRVAVAVGQDERHGEPLDAGGVHDGRRVGRAAPAVVEVRRRGHRAAPPVGGGRRRRRRWRGPLLVGGAGAGPDLQPGAVGRAVAGGVEALVGLRVDDVVRRGDGPLLGGGAVAVPQLHLGCRRRCRPRDVQALAERPDRAVGADGPLLGGGAVAVVELDRRAVGAVGARRRRRTCRRSPVIARWPRGRRPRAGRSGCRARVRRRARRPSCEQWCLEFVMFSRACHRPSLVSRDEAPSAERAVAGGAVSRVGFDPVFMT